MVAKSFQAMTLLTEPFTENNRQYVKVRNEKTGTVRKVRWYTAAEFHKLYPSEPLPPEEFEKVTFNAKKALGFAKGYITIFKGDIKAAEDWFRLSNARYHNVFGWYIVSTEDIPKDLPPYIQPMKLSWDSVSKDNKLKSMNEIANLILDMIFDNPASFVGEVGERLELNLTIVENECVEDFYGHSFIHTMKDDSGNLFMWTTKSKNWQEGSLHHIRGTVKEYKQEGRDKYTILTRCTEVA